MSKSDRRGRRTVRAYRPADDSEGSARRTAQAADYFRRSRVKAPMQRELLSDSLLGLLEVRDMLAAEIECGKAGDTTQAIFHRTRREIQSLYRAAKLKPTPAELGREPEPQTVAGIRWQEGANEQDDGE